MVTVENETRNRVFVPLRLTIKHKKGKSSWMTGGWTGSVSILFQCIPLTKRKNNNVMECSGKGKGTTDSILMVEKSKRTKVK